MSKSERTWLLFVGATVAGSLYYLCVFAAGVVLRWMPLCDLAVLGFGMIYLSSIARQLAPRATVLNTFLFVLSIAVGAGAFAGLLSTSFDARF